jgi:3-dehydroquinate synthase
MDESQTMPEEAASPLTVQVYLGERSYDILIGSGLLESLAALAAGWIERITDGKRQSGKCLVITDRNVETPHAQTVVASLRQSEWVCELMVLAAGEQTKQLSVVADVYDRLVAMRADRETVVIAVGGGVVGDLTGFAAATFARGVPFLQIPTTLLAHVDSSVGGKVGINHDRGKNLIGAFYQPWGVLIDTETLSTLPQREYAAGMAEVIKYGVILDPEFFEYLEQNLEGIADRAPAVLRHIVARCCRLKADVVEQDEYERTGLRAVLNYGHTFAHAFETLFGYGTLLHGEAVASGMIYASRLAERRGMIESNVTQRQIALLMAVGLPIDLPEQNRPEPDAVISRMYSDKKTVGGQLRFVLPTELGQVTVCKDVSVDDVRAVLQDPVL